MVADHRSSGSASRKLARPAALVGRCRVDAISREPAADSMGKLKGSLCGCGVMRRVRARIAAAQNELRKLLDAGLLLGKSPAADTSRVGL